MKVINQEFYKDGNILLNLCTPEQDTGKTFLGWTDNTGTDFDVTHKASFENINPV